MKQFRIAIVFLLISSLSHAGQVSGMPLGYVPPPDPGFDLYYQQLTGRQLFAARWGYHDGWTDGRHDRNAGIESEAETHDRYGSPPDHGGHYGVGRLEYEKLYRAAYLRGFEHGVRL